MEGSFEAAINFITVLSSAGAPPGIPIKIKKIKNSKIVCKGDLSTHFNFPSPSVPVTQRSLCGKERNGSIH